MTRPARFLLKRIALFCAIAATPLALNAASGEFTFVVGEVSVTKANGQRVTPVKGTAVDPGDRIVTGATGMVQLTMVDQARLSLRPNSQFVIEQYADRKDSEQGALLNLVRGTLRTFTGLIASTNRDKFVMKTRVATVGIRGSGNILYACDGTDCDESVAAEGKAGEALTVNHTIDGSHAVSNTSSAPPGTPAQQGGTQTLITGPGQTVLVSGLQPPRYIPTPRFIADSAISMRGGGKAAEAVAASTSSTTETRNFSPGDTPAVAISNQTGGTSTTSITPPPPSPQDATGNVGTDPLQLRDIVMNPGSPFLGQALPGQMTPQASGGGQPQALRSYSLYPYSGTAGGLIPTMDGGTLRDSQIVTVNGEQVSMGRYENASIGFGGGLTPIPGSIHWIVANAGYPTYLSDVLTGVAAYTLVAATSPTNQNNTVGTISNAQLNANFTNRTMQFQALITMPAAGANPGGAYQLGANNVPFSLNAFFGSTSDFLVITRGGTSSSSNTNLSGSFEGSFVGRGIGGAILGYGISDQTDPNPGAWNFIAGVAAFQGPQQNGAAPFREGRVSDADNLLPDFIRSYATTDRPDEVTVNGQNQVTAFSAPYSRTGPHSTYSLGTAQVVQAGFDPDTGLVWGRWTGGVANVTNGTRNEQLFLQNASLHYVFAGTQTGPTALPQTGTAVYDVMGSTSPTDAAGHVGTLNSATLNANFTNRTVDATVNASINNQTWNGSATGMPIYREQYFSAYSGTPIQGVPNPVPLIITCSPNCGAGATGSFDGFFTGRSGQGAGLLYNLGNNQGAVAFRRRGGG